jgi:predicted ATPase
VVQEAGLPAPALRLDTLVGTGPDTPLYRYAAHTIRSLLPLMAVAMPRCSISDPRLVVRAIAKSLGLRDTGAQPLAERLVAHLRARQLLLLLDNMEQVAAAAVADLPGACPSVTALAASTAPGPARAKALGAAGSLASMQGAYAQAVALLRDGLALYRELGDAWGAARTLCRRGAVASVPLDSRGGATILGSSGRMRCLSREPAQGPAGRCA